SGPRRPWAGSVRDYVLGTRVITGHGKHLRFGGEVMKNVAGYDLSRLMAASYGALGVITEVSLKVLPKPRQALSISLEIDPDRALQRLAQWGQEPLPISAACHDGQRLH
ncbi:glycolate oxidase subunit GlcE, partial [Pseudomonas sp. FSL R10-2172]|nr:glycolate oxidase subunit GlcE [Pseudomonas sp. FSL R10-2172]